jgi:Leucine-rich repeat (LRR) protein
MPTKAEDAFQKTEKRIEEARRTGAVDLDLSDLGLQSLPESIGRLAQLRNLQLYNNRLTALPESIGQLTELRELNLLNNRLTALPESIGQLIGLRDLI